MKPLVFILLSILIMSCGDSEPPTQVFEPPERAQYEIPSDIPLRLAEHFTRVARTHDRT